MINIFVGKIVYAELSNNLKYQKHITLFPTWQCWLGVHPGETAFPHVVIHETRLLLCLASSIPKISSPSVSISRRGRDLECLWEVIIGQDATSISLLLHWPWCGPVATEKLGSLPVVCHLKGSEFSWKINFVQIVTPKEKWKWEKFLKRA